MVKISLKSLVAYVKSFGKKLSATLFTSFDCEFSRNSIHCHMLRGKCQRIAWWKASYPSAMRL